MSSKPKRKLQRRCYTKETLKEALNAIKEGMSLISASKQYHIPRSTLHNKKMAKCLDRRPGPETVLTNEEENTLVQWVFQCSERGIPVSKSQLQNSVALLMKILNRENPFSNGRPGRHWYESFLRRHLDVVGVINENASSAKAVCNEAVVQEWFKNLRSYLEEKQLLNIDSTRIFSTETCLLQSLDDHENKENLYIQLAGNAAGQLLPPMLLFDYQRISATICAKLPKDWRVGESETGYMTPDNFYEYISECLLLWLNENKIELPILLFVDGRVPHLTLSLTEFCLKNKIELIALPPNSSHILNPLDQSFFPPLKHAWKIAHKTEAVNLLKENIAPVLKTVLDSLDVVNILLKGFQACGLHPLSENVLNYNKLPKKATEKVRTGLEIPPLKINEMLIKEEIEEPSLTYEKVLHVVESLMNPETLQNFRSINEAINESDEWTGEVKDTSLFYIWREISNFRKTEALSNSSQQNISEIYQTYGDCLEYDGSTNSDETEKTFFHNPLKLCVTEMDEE